jgi:hypothetical protein
MKADVPTLDDLRGYARTIRRQLGCPLPTYCTICLRELEIANGLERCMEKRA